MQIGMTGLQAQGAPDAMQIEALDCLLNEWIGFKLCSRLIVSVLMLIVPNAVTHESSLINEKKSLSELAGRSNQISNTPTAPGYVASLPGMIPLPRLLAIPNLAAASQPTGPTRPRLDVSR